MSDNTIEIINNDYIIEIEEVSYTIATDNISVCNYEYMPNKPKINSVELFGNKTSADLGLVSEAEMVLKEDISNKVITINEDSSDEQYPSAKCVYNNLSTKANIDLSNLSQTGQAVLDSKVPNTRTINGQPLSDDVIIDTTNSFSEITGQPNDNQNLATVLNSKQSTLVSGTNIKTINNNSILGSGNIDIQSGSVWGTITGTLSAQSDLNNALDDKVNISSLSQIYPVITTYENGASGYRIWSDGYCEQWGIQSIASGGSATISLLKTYKDTNYCIVNGFRDNGTTRRADPVMIFSVTSNSFVLAHQAGATMQCHWRTCGYLASGEY